MRFPPELLARLPPPLPFRGYLTGVGSRDIDDPDVPDVMRTLATLLFHYGFTWGSGGAPGSDTYIEEGVLAHPHYQASPWPGERAMAIYLPYFGFNERRGFDEETRQFRPNYLQAWRFPNYAQAEAIAKRIHPRGDQLKPNHLVMHARNAYQVLGDTLDRPTARAFLWAKPTRDGFCEGGTRTAYALAKESGVPIVNLAVPHQLQLIREYLSRELEKLAAA